MSYLAVNSSDLELARRVATRLSRPLPREVEDRPSGFVPFRSERCLKAVSATPLPHPERPTALPDDLVEFRDWTALLEWCNQAYVAEACLVVEPSGFVIASSGEWEFPRLEALGPQLLELARRARRLDETLDLRFVSVHLGPLWVTGLFSVREGLAGEFAIGFVGQQPMSEESCALIAAQFAHNLTLL
jgi:hypothetical protein